MNQQLTQTAIFNGAEYQLIDHNSQYWLTAEQVGKALGYSEDNQRQAIIKLYNRHNDEFTDEDTFVVKMTSNPKGGNPTTRIFSKTGCIKLGFFASTPRAKQFRQWSAVTLAYGENQTGWQEAQRHAMATIAQLTEQNQALQNALLKIDTDFKAIKVMYDGGLENWQIKMATNVSFSTLKRRMQLMRSLGLLGERGINAPNAQLTLEV